MSKGAIAGFFCFIAFLLLHIIIFRTRKINFRFRMLVWIFLSLFPLYTVLYIAISPDLLCVLFSNNKLNFVSQMGSPTIFDFLLGIFIYLFLFFGYCQFFFIIDRSISVRIMIELEKSADKKLNFEQIKNIYSQDYIFLRRIEQILKNKCITQKSGYYKNLRKGFIIARLFKFLKEYLRLGEGG